MSDKQVLYCMFHVSIDNTDDCSISADSIEPEQHVRTVLQPPKCKKSQALGVWMSFW